jgi:hypothetical protein
LQDGRNEASQAMNVEQIIGPACYSEIELLVHPWKRKKKLTKTETLEVKYIHPHPN